MEKKCIEIKDINLNKNGIFEGYASTFGNIDYDLDVIYPQAFEESLHVQNNKVVLLYQHQHETPIGLVKLYEDDIGLYAIGELNLKVHKAQEVYSLLKQGALNAMSIGFQAIDYELDDDGIRHLHKIDLLEVSVVTFPANPQARMLSVKKPQSQKKILENLEKINQKIIKHIEE